MSARLRRLSLATFLAAAAAAAPAHAAATKGYVVVLKAKPLASYTGGVAGRPATSPKSTGARKVSTRTADARSYISYLDGRQKAVIGRLPGARPDVLHRYRVALAGFSAPMTKEQAQAARKDPAVAHVFKDRFERAEDDAPGTPAAVAALLDGITGDSAAYLGLPAGTWNAVGGPDHAGEGVVVGVVDTGITPQHPSFADQPGGANGPYRGLPFQPAPSTFTGTCQTEHDPTFQCNNKLVGAEYFDESFSQFSTLNDDEVESPRDTDGHGSHTASTAAGNYGVDPDVGGNTLGVNRISGLAPAAQIAAYKALWTDDNGDNGGYSSDLTAAIDAAVADGVDVINYSIGSTGTAVLSPDSIAFLGASDAGVFVAVSAGNDGPDPGTIGDPAGVPWVTAAGAGSNRRTFTATASVKPTTGPAQPFKGASAGTGITPAAPVVDAATIPADGATADDAELCLPDSLDPDGADGAIVLCKRGAPTRLGTSYEVQQAGGVGEILYNDTQGDDLAGYPFYVPTLAVDKDAGEAIKALIANGATATITPGAADTHPAKQLAAFTSRGPSTATPDIAKPDVEAPGVDILGANSPIPIPGAAAPDLLFQVISGTSMASPHVAGAGALLRQRHPAWSPAEIKSALMLTASGGVTTETGDDATPFDTGSGEIDPSAATNAGLVVDAGTGDYLDYLAGADPTLGLGEGIPATDLNLASIADGAVLSSVTTSRTFTSALTTPETWTVDADVPGFDIALGGDVGDDGTFTIAAGRRKTVELKATRTDAPYDEYAFGALTLTSDGGQVLHVPISLQPTEIAAPDFVDLSTDTPSGSAPLDVDTGFAGSLFGYATGLAAPNAHVGEAINTDQTPSIDTPNAGNRHYDVTVPEGADLLQAAITNVAPDDSDLDLYLFHDDNNDGHFTDDELYDQSATGSALESTVDLAPDPGHYRFVVNGFGTANPSTYDFTTWTVADTSPNDLAGEPSVAITDPVTATLGGTVHPSLAFRGLYPKGTYVGLVRYSKAAGAPGNDDVLDASVVSITKTKDDAVPTVTASPSPTTSPTVTPTVTPTPTPKKLTLKVAKLALRKLRTVRLQLTLSLPARVTVGVRRGKKLVTRSKARSVSAGTHSRRFRLGKKLHHGTYTLRITARGSGQVAIRTVTLRIRKK